MKSSGPVPLRAINGADVRALFNHDSNYVIGRTTSGTLTLEKKKRLEIYGNPA